MLLEALNTLFNMCECFNKYRKIITKIRFLPNVFQMLILFIHFRSKYTTDTS